MMPKEKKKSIHKTKKKLARPAKQTRRKASSRKKKLVRRQTQPVGVLAVEVTEVEVIAGSGEDSVEETETAVKDAEDEHYPPEHGGTE
jgi:hypothetical protein